MLYDTHCFALVIVCVCVCACVCVAYAVSQRHNARLRGALSAVTVPTTVRSLVQHYGFLDSLAYAELHRLVQENLIAGLHSARTALPLSLLSLSLSYLCLASLSLFSLPLFFSLSISLPPSLSLSLSALLYHERMRNAKPDLTKPFWSQARSKAHRNEVLTFPL